MLPSIRVLDPSRIRDISADVLDDNDRIRVLPAAYWDGTTVEERALFGHRYGAHGFPTVELVEHLKTVIDGRPAIEIGAGHGVLAEALGIPATDSRMQEEPWVQEHYRRIGQPTVRYGPNVKRYDAYWAVRRYKPHVVIGSWVTHQFDPDRPESDGSIVGVDEEDVLAHCHTYVMIGNDRVHYGKKIWGRPHLIERPPWVYSRALSGAADFIATWDGDKP